MSGEAIVLLWYFVAISWIFVAVAYRQRSLDWVVVLGAIISIGGAALTVWASV